METRLGVEEEPDFIGDLAIRKCCGNDHLRSQKLRGRTTSVGRDATGFCSRALAEGANNTIVKSLGVILLLLTDLGLRRSKV